MVLDAIATSELSRTNILWIWGPSLTHDLSGIFGMRANSGFLLSLDLEASLRPPRLIRRACRVVSGARTLRDYLMITPPTPTLQHSIHCCRRPPPPACLLCPCRAHTLQTSGTHGSVAVPSYWQLLSRSLTSTELML